MDGGLLGVAWTTWAAVAAIKLPFVAALVWLCARIAKRAGYSGWRALWMLVPIGNIVAVWGFAFADWPRPADVPRGRRPGRAGAARAAPVADDADEAAAPGQEGGWVLSGFDGNGDRVRLELTDVELQAAGRGGVEIGRSRSCRLAVEDDSVSRRHALVRLDGEALCIVDLGSTNGTSVDGRRVRPDDGAVPVDRGAQVEIGDVRLSVNRG